MKMCFAYIRLFFFAAGILLGLQVPGFVEQYGSRLEARMLESEQSLSSFQTDADKHFGGDILRLIQHYKKNSDQVIQDGGSSIEVLYQRYLTLTSAHEHFSRNSLTPFLHTFLQPLDDVRDNTLSNYNFVVLLNTASIVWGVVSGLLLILVIDLFFGALWRVFRSIGNGSSRPVRHAQRKQSKHKRVQAIEPDIGL